VNTLKSIFSDRQSFSLLRWFSVLSLISIIAACVVSSYVLSRFLTAQMLQRDGVVMLEFVQSVVDTENIKARAAGREPDIRDSHMQELFDHLAGVPDMMRTNIYAPDQTLIWSSEKALIGKRFDDNGELKKSLKGEIEIETGKTGKSQHPKHEHTFLSDEPVDFVETYLPLRDKKANRVIGVAELYRVPNALFATINQGHRLIWLIGILAGLFLYGMLYWVVRRADATIRSQQVRLIESETLAAIGEMGTAVAHGIRNPLASIRSSAELCIDDKASPMVRESAADIMAQVDRMEKWVRDLLSYAQPEAGALARVQLATVIHRVCANFARDFEKQRIVPTVTLPAQLPTVVGDEAALEQVFSSLLSNAMEAMPDGGRVTISAEQTPRGAVAVTVSDTGIGILEKNKAKLFTAFQTTKPKGMGLGLALVRRIVQRSGGDIRIESNAGAGTEVALTFATAGAT
jgi:signal transduction histidine kinase